MRRSRAATDWDRRCTDASNSRHAQIRQYDQDWKPIEESLTAPGSVEGAISQAEARATEAEERLDQLRTGIGGNRGPSFELPPPRLRSPSTQPFDGEGWIAMYRTLNNSPDLFGQPSWPQRNGTVAAGKIDGVVYFGVNSGAPGYTDADWNRAADARDNLISKYPSTMATGNVGWIPNDSLFHAESTILLKAANDNGGSLADRTIEIEVDRELCYSCSKALPKLGMELGNPLVYVETGTAIRSTMWNGEWLSWRTNEKDHPLCRLFSRWLARAKAT